MKNGEESGQSLLEESARREKELALRAAYDRIGGDRTGSDVSFMFDAGREVALDA